MNIMKLILFYAKQVLESCAFSNGQNYMASHRQNADAILFSRNGTFSSVMALLNIVFVLCELIVLILVILMVEFISMDCQ